MTKYDTAYNAYQTTLDIANSDYRDTGDLAAFQEDTSAAKDFWQSTVKGLSRDTQREDELTALLANGGRVYGDTLDRQTVRLHSIADLYRVSDTTGAPREPLAVLLVGDLRESFTTVSDLITRA